MGAAAPAPCLRPFGARHAWEESEGLWSRGSWLPRPQPHRRPSCWPWRARRGEARCRRPHRLLL
eukprot:125112-Alexandrium_andersonii.AAC.1